ncbi:MAG: hypothetical protein J6V88_01510, partial [Kiritimatiellae bacterium]|nr:hypothetical protein [Kiritimatiellia bacterium]
MKRIAFLSTLAVFASVIAEPFKVGFLANKKYHADEYTSLPFHTTDGWELKSYVVKDDDSNVDEVRSSLLADLETLDMVAIHPLAPQFLNEEANAESFKKFLERGGAIVVPDCNYTDKFFWTDFLGEDYKHPEYQGYRGWYPAWLQKFPKEPSIRTFPSAQVDGGILWYHFLLQNAGKAWKPLLKCGRHNEPCAIMAHYGKGMVYLTNLRTPYFSFFENMRAATELHRAGLEVVAHEGWALTNAIVNASIEIASEKNASLAPSKYTLKLVISSVDGTSVVKRVSKGVASGKGVGFFIKGANTIRGEGTVRLTLNGDGEEIVLIDRKQTFSDLITLKLPRYRKMVSTKRRKANIELGFEVNPGKEKIATARWRAKVIDEKGKSIWSIMGRLIKGKRSVAFDAKIPIKTPAGDYRLVVEVAEMGKSKPHYAEGVFKIVEPTPSQVMIDQDNVLLKNGEAWFPFGMYGGHPDMWPKIKELGIDLQHSMNWHNGSYPTLEPLNQGLLSENKHRWPENLGNWAKGLSDKPYTRMHYIVDEPQDECVWKWEACRKAMAENDPHHPTYTVLLYPASFRYQKDIADILAVDPYPISVSGQGNVREVSKRLDDIYGVLGNE